ncbi:type IX secretion/gliding motility protein PorT/SprT [Natronoflexus pectinivorans]|uniref:Outer membrane protein with beta-barrel domain n=1 Tax=Natronoflexus pectinivorans TaxID=682526 RepID=A0A4R2GMW8_9BACT|nr:outer membrane beta-barrel protein [Natronoflexus pectinivorans]TCO09779.1 outer membrane protein with beta-barrel domain [Natronoflexus pectinivorans]
MKKVVSIILFILVCFALAAQPSKRRVPNLPSFDDRHLNFGFLIGLNTMDFRVVHANPSDVTGTEMRYADVVNLNPGINIGMVTSFRLNQYLNLRLLPGISFGQRDLHFISNDGEEDRWPLEVKSTFIECPILIKFNGARMTNAKPYLVAGVNPRFDLAKSKKDGILMRPFDLYWELGAGIDSYMSYFRFSTELKISVGMLNVLSPEGTGEPEDVLYTNVLDRLTSRIFVLTFYFE